MKIPHCRWLIVTLVFLAAVLNYVDRQVLSALAPTIQRDLQMSDREYANVVNLFLLAYTIAYLVSGKLVDVLGTRLATAGFVAWWSVANMLTAAAQGVQSLGAYRFALGLGEAGIWPGASKVVSEWFPARERALAIGLYTMGATVGATVAPYIVIPLASFPYAGRWPLLGEWFGPGTGWRVTFLFTGAAGLCWLVPWLLFYRLPRQSNLITPPELQLLERSAAEEAKARSAEGTTAWTWRQVFSSRIVWLLLLARLLTDPVWYFYQFWFPKYLNTQRGFSQEQLKITWMVYAAAGVGSLFGGWLSGVLIRRGFAPARSRLWIMLGCACLLPVSPFIARISGTDPMMLLTCIAILASLAWLINLSSLIVDLVPKVSLGTVFGVVAAGSTVGGILMNTVVAAMVSTAPATPSGFLDRAVAGLLDPLLRAAQGGGYGQWFIVMGCLHPLAWLLLYFGRVDRNPGETVRCR